MSFIKSLPVNSIPSNCINLIDISPDVRAQMTQIIKDVHKEIFIAKDLCYGRRMHILNNRKAMEGELIRFISDRIHQLNVDVAVREQLIVNLHKFSADFTLIDHYSYVNHGRPVFVYAHDDESDEDDFAEDISSNGYDTCDDLENLLVDELELEQFE